ncbi:hypothetical protein [Microlunatus parietis]|uniref:Uncharacterized protein n=1 Tax=Microlunatus parietis TaxID=682979 RepID=A0A7Y9IE50_9ACTN|nr:hypothetical protein [Microlunatus parietis]NYE75273.1 hypothetical protein [Microlunatus parietis]
MSQVVINCPSTHKDIPTGIDLDKAAWDAMKLDQGATQCLWCGELHVWSKQQARLEEPAAAEESEVSEETDQAEKTVKLEKARKSEEAPVATERLAASN